MTVNVPSKRRHRRSSETLGGRPTITPRDVEIFKLLTRYRYLDSHILFQLLPPDVHGAPRPEQRVENPKSKVSSLETDFKKRLRRLTDWGYIHRALDDQLKGDKKTIYFGNEIYELWDEGVLELSELGMDEESITGLRAGSGHNQFSHSLMVCTALASIELDVRSVPGVRFITGHEILAKAPKETRLGKDPWLFPRVTLRYRFHENQPVAEHQLRLRPDSPLFGFAFDTINPKTGRKFVRFATIEVENKNRVWCGKLDQNSWFRKVLAYKIYREEKLILKRYDIPNFFVYSLGPSQAHVESMKELVQQEIGCTSMFLFAPIRAFGHRSKSQPPLIPHLFTKPLETAGKGLFHMATMDGKKPPELLLAG